MPSKQSRQAKSIALSKCPRSRTIALFMTFFTHHHHNPKCKNEQHFVWVMVVRCGERSPHKPPMKGGSPRCARAPTPQSWSSIKRLEVVNASNKPEDTSDPSPEERQAAGRRMGHFRQMKAVSAHRPVLPNNNHIRFVRDAVVERVTREMYPPVEPHNKTENRPQNPRSTFTWKMSGNVRRAPGPTYERVSSIAPSKNIRHPRGPQWPKQGACVSLPEESC